MAGPVFTRVRLASLNLFLVFLLVLPAPAPGERAPSIPASNVAAARAPVFDVGSPVFNLADFGRLSGPQSPPAAGGIAVPAPSPGATAPPSPAVSPAATPSPSPTGSPTLTPSPSLSPSLTPTAAATPSPSPSATGAAKAAPTPTATAAPSPSPSPSATAAATPTPSPLPSPAPTGAPAPASALISTEKIVAEVSTDKEAVLASKDGKINVKLPAGSFAEDVRVELKFLPRIASTGARIVKLMDISAYATKRKDAPVKSLLKDATITVANNREELNGLDIKSLALFYLDEADRRWKPVPGKFDPATLTLTSSTNHFSVYGELANPVISGPGKVMGFQANLHSGTVKAGYPLELPPGRGGFEPALQLTYDSGAADNMKNRRSVGSWVGIGWSLDTGYISFDKEAGEYRLVMGGQSYEMYLAGDGYYVKPDAFYKITRDEVNQKWEVRDPGGTYYRFGGTADSSQYYTELDLSPQETIYYRWDLSLMTDTHGNNITVTYDQYVYNYSVRSAYPAQISYGGPGAGVTVVFNSSYDQNVPGDGYVRRDNPIGGATSFTVPKVMENRKLDGIEVRVGGVLARKYTFAYTTTDRFISQDYGGIYYSGKHTLNSITQVGADGWSTLPAMTFSYQDLEVFMRDLDGMYYSGNPGNPASLSWPHLTSVSNGFGATATFSYSQRAANTVSNTWTRQIVTSRTINPGLGAYMTYTYQYGDNDAGLPEYEGHGWNAQYRGFRKVKETDAAGNYTWHYFYTTGYEAATSKDWDRVTGKEYRTEQYSSGGQFLMRTENTWNWTNSTVWDPVKPYTFLDQWDGYGSYNGFFNGPWGVASDSSGNVYVVDKGNGHVEKFDSNGNFLLRFGGLGCGPNQLIQPEGIAVSSDGKVYVADHSQGCIFKFNSSGAYETYWSVGWPSAVAVSADGQYVYVADCYADYVRKYTNSGTPVASWGGEGMANGQFQFPYGVAVYRDGNGVDWVYVADTGNNRVQKFTSSGGYVDKFDGSPAHTMSFPWGIAVDGSGNIYVSDSGARVMKFDASNNQNFIWQKTGLDGDGNPIPGNGDGEFNGPVALAISGSSVLVSDRNNQRVQKLAADTGNFFAKWGEYRSGNGSFGAAADIGLASSGNAAWVVDRSLHEVRKFDLYGTHNPATDKRLGGSGPGSGLGEFWGPSGIGISPKDGALYVADYGNSRVQKFDSSGNNASVFASVTAPVDVAVFYTLVPSETHYIYVLSVSNRVYKYSEGGTPLANWATLSNPTGIGVDSAGNVYVAASNFVQKFDGGGNPLTSWGGTGRENGQFVSIRKIAIDSGNNVYVGDGYWWIWKNRPRVQKFTSAGVYLTDMGNFGTGGGAFNWPEGIDVSPDGDFVYVANDARIEKFRWLGEETLDRTEVTRGAKTARTDLAYDGAGNVRRIYKYSDASQETVESTVYRTYYPNKGAPWILNKLGLERVYAGKKESDDGGAGLKLETRYFYDGASDYTTPPTKGDLTKTEKYDPGPPAATISFTRSYDNYGNLASETDANGRTTDYDYDASLTFLIRKKLPLVAGQQQRMEENYAWNYTGAKMSSETDVNGQSTYYYYDTFWRPVKLVRPGDDYDNPTVQHQYNSWGTITQQHVNTIQKTDATHSLWSKRYFDGLGRVVQTQDTGEGTHAIITTTAYDARGLVEKEYVPEDVSSAPSAYVSPYWNWKYVSSGYDGLGRLTAKTKPDGTSVTHAYSDWLDTVTNERGKQKKYYSDAFGRLVKVEELDDSGVVYAATVYQYDFLDNLTKVTDNAGNETVSTYNGFSRKVSMSDPDMGAWSYGYDAQGNLISQTDALGQTITFVYDALNRLTEKKQGATTMASYSYDDTSGGNLGKLKRTGMNDPNGASGSMAYRYDSRGRLIQETRTLGGTAYTTGYAYDSADRQVTVTYPITGEIVTQGHNGRGLPNGLTSTSSPSTIVSSAQYNAFAMPAQVDLGNGTRTTYGYWNTGGTYDHQTNGTEQYSRLYELKTVKTGTPDTVLQDVTHTWDAVGNLTQRQNLVDVETESFGYDFLDRLTSESNFLFKFGDTGDASSRLGGPRRLAVDGNGNIFVADTGNNRVAKFNSSGMFQYAYGSYGTGDGQFNQPSGVATAVIGGDLYVFVADLGNCRVQKLKEQNGALVFVAKWGEYGTASGQMISPSDIVYNSTTGYLYVVEISNHRVQYFNTNGQDPTGNGSNWWGGWGTGDSQFKYPQGIAADSSGNVYVADGFNRKVKKFSSSGTSLGSWGSSGSGQGQFGFLEDVAVDSAGNIYAVDVNYHRVQKLTPTGQYTFNFATWWGSSGSGQSQFSGPYGVTVSSSRIYVVDTGNSRIQTFDLLTASGWSYNQIGNMTMRDGTAYSYGSAPPNPPQPHAVTTAGTNSYTYDKNGNMTNRAGKTLEWDIENRLKRVKDGQTTIAEYVYDGDGFRVKKTENGVDTLYINRYYEKRLSNPLVEVYYYYLGDKMVGYKEVTAGNPPTTEFKYVHQDHLTGTSMTTYGTTGLSAGTIKYFPYGGTRASSGLLPVQKFTGQRLDDVGLYYYGARYYDAGLGRFISADPVVQTAPLPFGKISYALLVSYTGRYSASSPRQGQATFDPQFLNRYTYGRNNPLAYVDESGNLVFLACVVGGLVGAAVGFGAYAFYAYTHQYDFNWGQAGLWTAGGALAGSGVGALVGAYGPVAAAAFSSQVGAIGYGVQRGLESFSRAGEFGIQPYRDLVLQIARTGLSAHHLIEERFASVLGVEGSAMPSIALTLKEHQVFTRAWRAAIPYLDPRNPGRFNSYSATRDQIWAAAQTVYSKYPVLIEAIGQFLYPD